MLDDNTNKVVWVGVAVGVVAIIGIAAMALFPDVFKGMKASIHGMIGNFSHASDDVQASSGSAAS